MKQDTVLFTIFFMSLFFSSAIFCMNAPQRMISLQKAAKDLAQNNINFDERSDPFLFLDDLYNNFPKEEKIKIVWNAGRAIESVISAYPIESTELMNEIVRCGILSNQLGIGLGGIKTQAEKNACKDFNEYKMTQLQVGVMLFAGGMATLAAGGSFLSEPGMIFPGLCLIMVVSPILFLGSKKYFSRYAYYSPGLHKENLELIAKYITDKRLKVRSYSED